MQNLMSLKPEIIIENVVATSSLGRSINLKKTIKHFDDVKYVPDKFPGAIIKTKSPRSTILLFKSGSIVCTGTKSEDKARLAIKAFAETINRLDTKTKNELSDIKIENIVSSCNLRNKVHLEQAARSLPRSLYEPEQFSGIIHRMHYPKTVVLLFASGKLVCTGAKVTSDILLSVNTLRSLLEEKNLINYDV